MSGAKSNVCQVSTLTRWGGVERMLLDFLEHAGHSRLAYSVLCTSSSPDVMRPFQCLGLPIFQPERAFRYDPKAIGQMAHWLRACQVQLVHSHNAYANAWGSISALLAGVPVYIGGEHGSVRVTRPPMSWLNRWAYHQANIVVVNSRATQRMVGAKYKVPVGRMRIVYNASLPLPDADLTKLRSGFGLGTGIVVGSVGRLVPGKDYKTFADAAKLVLQARPDIRFVLVGGGTEHSVLCDYVRTLGIADQFILTDWRRDAREILQLFDVFVSTSVYESFGNVFVEAALAGIPVVAPRVDAVPEVVVDGETGRLLSPRLPVSGLESGSLAKLPGRVLIDGALCAPLALEPRELADAILELSGDAGLRRQYGEAGRQRAMELFSIERYKRELEQIYLEALDD